MGTATATELSQTTGGGGVDGGLGGGIDGG